MPALPGIADTRLQYVKFEPGPSPRAVSDASWYRAFLSDASARAKREVIDTLRSSPMAWWTKLIPTSRSPDRIFHIPTSPTMSGSCGLRLADTAPAARD